VGKEPIQETRRSVSRRKGDPIKGKRRLDERKNEVRQKERKWVCKRRETEERN
jgi:hypothetical protein